MPHCSLHIAAMVLKISQRIKGIMYFQVYLFENNTYSKTVTSYTNIYIYYFITSNILTSGVLLLVILTNGVLSCYKIV